MDIHAAGAPSRFADRVIRLLERVEHRRARTENEKEAIYRLRYEAYHRENYIEPRGDGLLYDPAYDDTPNCWNIGTYIDGELASALRVHAAWREGDILPDGVVFCDVVAPHLRRGRVIVDPTRFATKFEFSRRFPEMPYLTLRPGWMAGAYFGADYIVSTMRVEHQAYYKRVFGYELWSEPRAYPRVNRKVACMGFDYFAQKERVEARYPFFRSTWTECYQLFGRSASTPLRFPNHIGAANEVCRQA
jgi:N-acyl amino acid synthase FeeM